MMTYLEDAHCSLSNNISENSLRPLTCGRKNWLFSDTTAGAHASMIVCSLIEMAKADGNKEMADEEDVNTGRLAHPTRSSRADVGK